MGFSTKIVKIFTSARSRYRAEQLAGMRDKLDMCSDAKIKNAAEELLASIGNPRSKNARNNLNKAEHLLDTVNTAEGKYCPLYNELLPTTTPGILTKLIGTLGKRFKNASLLNLSKQSRLATYSAPRSAVLNSPGLLKNPNLETVTRFSSLKRFISQYPNDAKTTSYLYEKYYLSELDADTANFLRNIDSEYGIKVFSDKPLSKAKLLYLKEELALAKKAGGSAVEYPPLIDITDFDPLINRYFGAYGIAVKYKHKNFGKVMYGRRVGVVERHLTDTSFRHEFIGHYNDSKLSGTKLTAGRIKLSPQQQKELEDAGLPSNLIDYAKTNKNEMKAVSVQGDISKYSQEYVDELVDSGLPRWIEHLEPVDMQKYLPEIFTDKKSTEILEEIRHTLGGNIPNNISIALIEHPDKAGVVNELLKLKKINEKPLFAAEVQDFIDLQPDMLALLKNFAKLDAIEKDPYLLKLFASGYDFDTQQVSKLYEKAFKAEQNGSIFDFDKFLDRYFSLKSRAKEKQLAQNLFSSESNVTNIKSKSFNQAIIYS